ncbi:MAG: 2-amino-4-hydroxy-6-hydroxymethyldihydropteridine diphosphokinase [Abditibacteriales bacterium]|nr:2-amino-4-hydroxy-6-hydroxymethyldihydropteridine diphosphokinase [Abditibacteriales bacterium]MDW8365952.1 2-amino-4-hydroxy-6-hydroxymethyldihydropteridine diphosphokinase [Abditibacteriales bacterium]
MPTVYLSLGSNLGDREANLRRAVQMLNEIPRARVVAVSSLYETAPIEDGGPDDYLNLAVKVDVDGTAQEFHHECSRIEQTLGRPAPPRRGPRLIDIDILLFDDACINEPGLQVPHPRMTQRAFVLVPLSEIEPSLTLHGKSLTEWLRLLGNSQTVQRVKRAEEWWR